MEFLSFPEVSEVVHLPGVLPNPRPHHHQHRRPYQAELYKEGVEVGGRFCHDVPHQVNPSACEIVKLVRGNRLALF